MAIIYCSGRNELIGANAHTNFKITQTKGSEVFMLSDASGIFQDSIRVLPNQKSHTEEEKWTELQIGVFLLNGTPNAIMLVQCKNIAQLLFFLNQEDIIRTRKLTLSSPDPIQLFIILLNGDEPIILLHYILDQLIFHNNCCKGNCYSSTQIFHLVLLIIILFY